APPDACRLVVPPPTPAPVAHSHAATDPARVSAARSLREGVHVPVRIAQSRGATAPALGAPLRAVSAACASAPACYARISSAVQEGPANQLHCRKRDRELRTTFGPILRAHVSAVQLDEVLHDCE